MHAGMVRVEASCSHDWMAVLNERSVKAHGSLERGVEVSGAIRNSYVRRSCRLQLLMKRSCTAVLFTSTQVSDGSDRTSLPRKLGVGLPACHSTYARLNWLLQTNLKLAARPRHISWLRIFGPGSSRKGTGLVGENNEDAVEVFAHTGGFILGQRTTNPTSTDTTTKFLSLVGMNCNAAAPASNKEQDR